MYHISSKIVRNKINELSRTFRAKLVFSNSDGTSTVLRGNAVGKIETEHTQSDDDSIQIGAILSRYAEIHLFSDNYTPKRGAVFQLYLYLLDWDAEEDDTALDDEYIPFGEFVIVKAVQSYSETIITCYDKLYASNKVYIPAISFPASDVEVVEDVILQLGITSYQKVDAGNLKEYANQEIVIDADGEEVLVSAGYGFTITSIPENSTCKEVLEWISAVYGGNGITDRNGAYTILFFTGEKQGFYTVTQKDVEDIELAEKNVCIKGIRCWLDDENTLEAGYPDDAYAVEMRSPWMTQSRLKEILNDLKKISWRPGSVTGRSADPRWDLFDTKSTHEANSKMSTVTFPITSIRYHFDGGLSADMEACGNIENIEEE